MKLNAGQMHLLRLTLRDGDAEGWAKVSKILWPLVLPLPDDLVEKRESDNGGHIRLTAGGKAVAAYS